LINEARVRNGLPGLLPNSPLTSAAQSYAALSFEGRDPFDLNHNLDGTPKDRAERQGYVGGVGEVLAASFTVPEEVLDLWLDSESHMRILLRDDSRDLGVACYGGPHTIVPGGVYDVKVCVAMVGIV
jgi:uncharacterized protein YkwD